MKKYHKVVWDKLLQGSIAKINVYNMWDPLFTKYCLVYWTQEKYEEFKTFLALNPEAGDVEPNAGGSPKNRPYFKHTISILTCNLILDRLLGTGITGRAQIGIVRRLTQE